MLVGPQSSNVASGCILNLLGCCESGEVNISEAFWLKLLVTTMIFSGAVMVAGMRRCFVLLLVLPKFCIAMPTSGAAVAVSANGGTTLIAVRRSMTKTLPAQRTKVWEAVSSTPGSHACRGDSRTDNSKSYYEVTAGIGSLEACQSLCEEQASEWPLRSVDAKRRHSRYFHTTCSLGRVSVPPFRLAGQHVVSSGRWRGPCMPW